MAQPSWARNVAVALVANASRPAAAMMPTTPTVATDRSRPDAVPFTALCAVTPPYTPAPTTNSSASAMKKYAMVMMTPPPFVCRSADPIGDSCRCLTPTKVRLEALADETTVMRGGRGREDPNLRH